MKATKKFEIAIQSAFHHAKLRIQGTSTRRLFIYPLILGSILIGILYFTYDKRYPGTPLQIITLSTAFFFWGLSGLVLALRGDSKLVFYIPIPGSNPRFSGWVIVIGGWGLGLYLLINLIWK